VEPGQALTGVAGSSVSPESNPYHGKKCREGGCFWYAESEAQKSAIGMEYATTISEPHVSSFNEAHSIDQLALGAGAGLNTYTVEVGWDVDPHKWSKANPGKPHLFVFINKEQYKGECEQSGKCYDDEAYWTPLEGVKLKMGEALEPGPARFIIGAENFEGNWWIWAGNEWIGYVSGSFWGGKFTKAESESNYGEVWDSEEAPTTAMGDGEFGGNSGATLMAAPVVILSETKEETTSLKASVTNSKLYSIGDINGNKASWHFGGPGLDPVAPSVTTREASAVISTEATVNGEVDPNNLEAKYHFEWGSSVAYGNNAPSVEGGKLTAGSEVDDVNAKLTGLSAGITYHYRLVASNADGTTYGADKTFTTRAVPSVADGTFAFGATEGCGTASDWSFFTNGGTQTACAVVSAERAEQGQWYEEMTDSVSGGSIYQDVPFPNGATTSVEFGETYTFSVWVRAPSKEVKGTVAIWGLTGEEARDSGGTSFTLPGGSGWQRVEVPLTITKTGEERIRVQVYQYTANATMYLDGAELINSGVGDGTFAFGATEGCGTASDWSFFTNGGTQTKCAVVSAEKAEQGQWYEEMTDSVSGGSIYQDVPLPNGPTTKSEFGDTYMFAVWVRAPSKEAKGTVAIWGLAGEEARDSAGTNFTLSAGSGWRRVEVPLTITKTGEERIRVQVYQYTANATLYLDGAQLIDSGVGDATFAFGATESCGTASDWSFFTNGGTQNGCAVVSAERAEQGQWYEEMTDSVSGGSIYQDVPFPNGSTTSAEFADTYTFSMWVRAPSKEVKGTVAIWGLAGEEARDSGGTSFTLAGGSGWQRVEVPLTITKTGEERIRIQVYQYTANATMYLDGGTLIQ
jgi:Neprosin